MTLSKAPERRLYSSLAVAGLLIFAPPLALAAEHHGQITFKGLPVPGASITATRGDTILATTADASGGYSFPTLEVGAWVLRVAMIGFAPVERTVDVGLDTSPVRFELTLMQFEEIAKTAVPVAPESAASQPAVPVQTSAGRDAPDVPPSPPLPADPTAAADGLLINGSVNNGASSLFAQPAAFGNNRRRPGALYNGGIGILGGHSSLDARPYSFASTRPPKLDYGDVHLLATFGGPLRLPGVIRNNPTFFAGYQRTQEHNATTQAALMPTALERAGDFSQSVDAFGRPVQPFDPGTGFPFASGVIPADRISPQAAALLRYYPAPNVAGDARYNYQRPVVTAATQHSVQSRVTQPLSTRSQLLGTLAYQRYITDRRYGRSARVAADSVRDGVHAAA